MFQEFAFPLPSVEPMNNDHVAWTQILNLVSDGDAWFRHFLSRRRRERPNLNPFKINKFRNKLIDKKEDEKRFRHLMTGLMFRVFGVGN